MEVDKNLFIIAAIITISLFGLIYIANQLFDSQREAKLLELNDEVIDELENMKAFTALSAFLGEKENCDLLQSQLEYFDKSIWGLGKKLDSYEEASRNIFSNPFYEKQKKRFTVNQILYLSMLEKMKNTCNSTLPVVILYFYANSKDCRDCDAQSFVLTDINKEADEEVAIFSLDTDIDVIGTGVLMEYYGISGKNLPCIVVEGKTTCGLNDKKALISHICSIQKNPLCSG